MKCSQWIDHGIECDLGEQHRPISVPIQNRARPGASATTSWRQAASSGRVGCDLHRRRSAHLARAPASGRGGPHLTAPRQSGGDASARPMPLQSNTTTLVADSRGAIASIACSTCPRFSADQQVFDGFWPTARFAGGTESAAPVALSDQLSRWLLILSGQQCDVRAATAVGRQTIRRSRRRREHATARSSGLGSTQAIGRRGRFINSKTTLPQRRHQPAICLPAITSSSSSASPNTSFIMMTRSLSAVPRKQWRHQNNDSPSPHTPSRLRSVDRVRHQVTGVRSL
ncbi:MAG: hypothetical protein CM15mP89_1530 [Gammaproteobacteria bacterium]|nr:MAG: hypothetical protein CM15mP89_1530 [Gammaproteobacteria bacterium]